MGAPEGSDVGTPVGGLVGSADGLVGTDVGTPVGLVVGTPVGDSVVGTDDGAGVGSGTMTCSLRAPSSASFTNCRRRPSGALLDGLWAAAGAARQASATSAAIDRIFVGFAVSGLALDPRGVRRGLPGAGVGAQIASLAHAAGGHNFWADATPTYLSYLSTMFPRRAARWRPRAARTPRAAPPLAVFPARLPLMSSGQKGCHSAAPAAHSSLASL